MSMIGVAAGLSAAIAVAAGAFGAHGAAGPIEAGWLETGGVYQLIHAVAAVALLRLSRGSAVTLLLGAAIFSFSLYAMALGAPRWFGAVAPIGGTLLIMGWISVAWAFWRKRGDLY